MGVSLWTLALTGRQSVLGGHWAVRKSNILSKSSINGANTAVLQSPCHGGQKKIQAMASFKSMETMAAFLGLGPMGGQDGSAKRCGESWGQGLTAVRRIQSLDVHGDVGLRDVARF